MGSSVPDRIEKEIFLRASRARVWRALVTPAEFGAWFGVRFENATFTPGASVRGNITYPGYEHLVMDIVIDEVVPERRFSYRWHPHAVDAGVDYSSEERTLVVFELFDAEGGTRLTVVESGFDRVPAARRARAFEMNEGGWTEQMKNIEAHVRKNPS